MAFPLLQTKLYIPLPRPQVVARPAITTKLQLGVALPLTLVAAPAGFGKTTLVSEWITRSNQPVAWLSLDDEDNDPARFFLYLVAALRMLICPALVLALMKLTGAAALAPDGDTILLISLLAAMAPTAAMITQISQIYKQDAVYASAINVFTTLCCIVTMPAFVYVYELI